MTIINKNINEIKPYEKNPRKNEEAVKYVANSIKEFGFKVPIVIDNNNVIVAGHTRLLAAKELKIKEVPCIVADDLTDKQIKAFRLADNKVSEKANWDFDLLFDELDELTNFDMTDFGFNDAITNINWDEVEEINEKNYNKPEHTMLECPFCHKRDRDIHFKKIKVDKLSETDAENKKEIEKEQKEK